MSEPLSSPRYEVIETPKNNNFDIIIETSEIGIKVNGGTKKSQRNAKPNQKIVRLTYVPFPPRLTVKDIIEPRNLTCDKRKVPNKFFIYRKWYTMCLEREEQKNDQTSISPYISEQWRNEPQEVKDYYAALSKSACKLFKIRYGKEGFKANTPKKPRNENTEDTNKNDKSRRKKLTAVKPNIKKENLDSTGVFEPLHQQQLHQQQPHQQPQPYQPQPHQQPQPYQFQPHQPHQPHLSAYGFSDVHAQPLRLEDMWLGQQYLQQPLIVYSFSESSSPRYQTSEQSFDMEIDDFPESPEFPELLDATTVFEGQANDGLSEFSLFDEGQVIGYN
ncbi:3761_t:CDS:2 [Diversispora eburnea]|uniref:3761_t:CDS:1 n=1 Tax=Diversispora eburnea TaxID=1213867 RepID=A0A9N9GR96_9GLOM|nr:3761_t:CDS:2 [Diversispora eburnea]